LHTNGPIDEIVKISQISYNLFMAWNIKHLELHLLIGSTLVEGSTLTEDEAREVLKGRTVVGHHVTEIRELLNHRAAIQWLASQVDRSPYLSLDLVLAFHRRLFDGLPGSQGRFKTQANFTYQTDGSRHEYVKPERVPAAMAKWLAFFNETAPGEDPGLTAARLYHQFESIHPFEDGNGRVGRILVAYWLHWKHRQLFSFYARDKIEHLQALEAANRGEMDPLNRFFRTRLLPEDR
jgi:Fic family protein